MIVKDPITVPVRQACLLAGSLCFHPAANPWRDRSKSVGRSTWVERVS